MGSDSSLTLRNMLEGLRVNSAFKSVTHNEDGQLDYVLMKTGINAAKYVAGSFKNVYSDHKSLFLRISTDDDDVVTTSSRVIDAIEDMHTIGDNTRSKEIVQIPSRVIDADTHTIEDNTSSKKIVQIPTSATVSDIENNIRFDNCTGNNNCWLNCVIQFLPHMLNLVPEQHMYEKNKKSHD